MLRITKTALNQRWAVCTALAIVCFAVIAMLDSSLRSQSGLGTADLQNFVFAGQYQSAHLVWTSMPLALRAGFALGFDYLFMPLYAASFFYSGIIAREAFAPRPSRLRRLLTLLAAVPIAGAVLDACENGLEMSMLLGGADNTMARIAFTISNAKMGAIYVGLVLLAGALLARSYDRRKRKPTPP
jgi:hypothetical protein